MQRLLRLTFFALLTTAFIGCDGGGDNENDDLPNPDYAVTASVTTSNATIGSFQFNSNEVFANLPPGGFAFGFSAEAPLPTGEGTITILIALQNQRGEPLSLGRPYEIGADEETQIFASGSVVFDFNGENNVLNANEGSGSIGLDALSAGGASGIFSFTATSTEAETETTEITVSGGVFAIRP